MSLLRGMPLPCVKRSYASFSAMSFFGYRSSSSRASQQETHLSELERLRGRQLASLVRAGGRAKNQQQTAFEVPVADTPRGPLTLQLQLPTEFPVKVPRLKVSIPVQHQWLDAAGNVQGHPDLNKWTAHSDLGRIVTEIVTELRVVANTASTSKPPVSPARSSSPAPAASLSPYPGSRASYSSPSRQSSQALIQQPKEQTPDTSKMQRTQMPVIPAIFPELEELSLSQLEKLNSDKHSLKKFVKELTSVKEFTQLRDEVLHSNMGIAKTTLGYEAELRELQEVVEAQRVELRAAQQTLAEKQARQQRIVAVRLPLYTLPHVKHMTLLYSILNSAIDQTHCWSSSQLQQKMWTTSRTRLPLSSLTVTSTWLNLSPHTYRSVTCTTSAH
ncbi:hypothetical protein L916_17237 [Phytophthora nicotianae]|uniref:VPS37 C-terminal domain-containing protein n=2 Tax=Phytophthora nicotianae TaxID=4792 RepID=W2I5Z0_PHYNI|nr:hypothetical protein L916_17237 [Phytophthora nicotianae]ETO64710.1 hypothetical protein F444_17852 [Phytophthora nicotianae P1976]